MNARLNRSHAPRRWSRAATIAVLLMVVAFALRFTYFSARSMWLDEGTSLQRAVGSWPDLFSSRTDLQGIVFSDPHPPLYFAALKVWRSLAGTDEFQDKMVAGFAGVAAVAVAYALGRRVLNKRAALINTGLAMLCAGYQWYSQEVRHYAWFFCLASLMLYAQARFMTSIPVRSRAGQLKLLLLWGLIAAIGVASHYLLAVLLIGQAAAFVLMLLFNRLGRTRAGRVFVIGLVGLIVVAIAVIFIAAPTLANRLLTLTNLASIVDVVPLLITGTFFGLTAADPTGGWVDWALLLLIGLGLLMSLAPYVRPFVQADRPARHTWNRRDALAVIVLASLLALLGICYLQRGTNTFRYTIMLSPALLLMLTVVIDKILPRRVSRVASAQISSTGRVAGRVAVGSVLLAGLLAVESFGWASATLPSLIKYDDWRGMSRYLANHWRPGDVLVLHPLYSPYQVVKYYLGGVPVPIVSLPVLTDEPDPVAALQRDYARVWYVNTTGEPMTTAGNGLFTSFYHRDKEAFPSHNIVLQLDLFETRSPLVDALPGTATPISEGAPEPHPQLAGYELQPCDAASPAPCSWLSLYWRRGADANSDLSRYQLSARLEADQVTWTSLQTSAQLAAAPVDWATQAAGPLFRVDYVMPMPLGLPAQAYQLNLTLQAGDKLAPVSTASLVLTPEQVSHAIRLIQGFGTDDRTPLWNDGDVSLLAADFPSIQRPGNLVPLALTWRASRTLVVPDDDWQTAIRVEPIIGNALAASLQPASVSQAPIHTWPANEPERTLASVQLPYDITPGFYKLTVARVRADGRETRAMLGWLQIEPYPMSQLSDSPTVSVNAQVGETNLLGYRLDQPFERGETLNFFTYWQFTQAPTRDGVIVLFVFGPDGKPIAQDDSPPEQGARSTRTYRAGEGLKQLHRIVLPADAGAGVYHLYAGIYNRGDQQRWEAAQNGAPAKDMLVDLGPIELK